MSVARNIALVRDWNLSVVVVGKASQHGVETVVFLGAVWGGGLGHFNKPSRNQINQPVKFRVRRLRLGPIGLEQILILGEDNRS